MRAVMPTSVMPKGVEHNKTACDAYARANMPTSVMPKGVEHIDADMYPDYDPGCPPR